MYTASRIMKPTSTVTVLCNGRNGLQWMCFMPSLLRQSHGGTRKDWYYPVVGCDIYLLRKCTAREMNGKPSFSFDYTWQFLSHSTLNVVVSILSALLCPLSRLQRVRVTSQNRMRRGTRPQHSQTIIFPNLPKMFFSPKKNYLKEGLIFPKTL